MARFKYYSALNEIQGRNTSSGISTAAKLKRRLILKPWAATKRYRKFSKEMRSGKKEILGILRDIEPSISAKEANKLGRQIVDTASRVNHASDVRARYAGKAYGKLRKYGIIAAATGVGLKGAAMTYDKLKNRNRYKPQYDIYARHGHTVANTEPRTPNYSEPFYSVYEEIYKDLEKKLSN